MAIHRKEAAHVVMATDMLAGHSVFFDGNGHWTPDVANAQIARSPVGRKALLRVASALAPDSLAVAPNLAAI